MTKRVVIAGDSSPFRLVWHAHSEERSSVQPGGAALIFRLLQEGLRALPDDQRLDAAMTLWPPASETSSDDAPPRGLDCSRFPLTDHDQERTIWRVEASSDAPGPRPPMSGDALPDEPPDLLVLDDPHRAPSCLSLLKTRTEATWVILRLTNPLPPDTTLWDHVLDAVPCHERLIVVTSIGELRHPDTEIRADGSWERTARDLVRVMSDFPFMNSFAHFIVFIGTVGAVSFTKSEVNWIRRLYFDPRAVEGSWHDRYLGQMPGIEQCLVAALALQALNDGVVGDIRKGVLRGLEAARVLHRTGFESSGADVAAPEALTFPHRPVAAELLRTLLRAGPESADESLTSVDLPAPDWCEPDTLPAEWTILQAKHPSDLDAELLAYAIVERGPEQALHDVPLACFGKLVTADHREIDALNSLRVALLNYLRSSESQPLCVAVFGPPGSGKSFAVKALAQSLAPHAASRLCIMEANLSRFLTREDLADAFEEVQRIARAGTDDELTGAVEKSLHFPQTRLEPRGDQERQLPRVVPVVFWDEFDCRRNGQELGWLEAFIEPMYSRSFGKAIFAFAGGTSSSWEAFEIAVAKQPPSTKALDFRSRVTWHLDIPGVDFPPNSRDNFALVRRAIVLRANLDQRAPWLQQEVLGRTVVRVEEGVARALLLTTTLKSGARSLETIVRMSKLEERVAFGRSDLPHDTVIGQHLSLDEFRSVLDEPDQRYRNDVLKSHYGWPLTPEMVGRWREGLRAR